MRAIDYRKKSWNLLAQDNNYWMLFIATAIVVFILIPSVPLIIGLLIMGALTVGLNLTFLRTYRGDKVKIEYIFEPFEKSFINSMVANLLKIFFVFLWSLLLVVPGIIKAIAYSMSEFILADNPEMDGFEVLKASEQLMMGHKWRFFCLQVSFIGWYFLAVLTFGIGMFFLAPYVQAANTAFYLDLVGENQNIHQTKDEIEVI